VSKLPPVASGVVVAQELPNLLAGVRFFWGQRGDQIGAPAILHNISISFCLITRIEIISQNFLLMSVVSGIVGVWLNMK
jgi:hypothetical protein